VQSEWSGSSRPRGCDSHPRPQVGCRTCSADARRCGRSRGPGWSDGPRRPELPDRRLSRPRGHVQQIRCQRSRSDVAARLLAKGRCAGAAQGRGDARATRQRRGAVPGAPPSQRLRRRRGGLSPAGRLRRRRALPDDRARKRWRG
jgi:hypothetical protein